MTAVSNGSSLAAMDLYQCFRPSGARQLAAAISARFGQGLSLKRFLHCVHVMRTFSLKFDIRPQPVSSICMHFGPFSRSIGTESQIVRQQSSQISELLDGC